MNKHTLRKKYIQIRKDIDSNIASDKSLAASNNFLNKIKIDKDKIIASYIPFKSELSTNILNKELFNLGARLCLPVILANEKEMVFKEYNLDDKLRENINYKNLEPSSNAKILNPQIIIVPLVAFDKNLYRLGMGGGFYDATLKKSNALKIGFAYEIQLCSNLILEPHDQKLDLIITEKNIWQ